METDEILEMLDEAISWHRVLCIERPDVGGSALICIPIARSEELLLAHMFCDFTPDGYSILRIDDIYEALRDESEIFFENIITCEKVYQSLKAPTGIELGSWPDALASIMAQYGYCVIESEKEEDFLIGKAIEFREWDFTFWYFDAAGKWDDELDTVDYDDITSVSFDDNYTNTITKYIADPN